MNRVVNFGPGPAVLPEEVLTWASEGVRELGSCGMSVLEISHRAGEYRSIQDEARERVLRLLRLDPLDFTVMFLGGGASLQFYMAPLNFIGADGHAAYIDTGVWSRKAMEQARRVGGVEVIASSKGDAYAMLPDVAIPAPGACYVHITTNNTIEGTQWRVLPESGTTPLIADASSDFLACDRSGSALSMIYAGAQKNAGPAGVTVVAAKRSFLATAREDVPEMLSYRVHEREDSVYNTPPVFGVYIVRLVCKWIEEQGGVAAMEAANKAKADLVYGALDSHPDVYEPTVTVAAHRSHVNLTFRLCDPTREDAFMDGARDRGMVGLRGHRAVGGFRASMYNAFPMAWAERFADYLEAFARG